MDNFLQGFNRAEQLSPLDEAGLLNKAATAVGKAIGGVGKGLVQGVKQGWQGEQPQQAQTTPEAQGQSTQQGQQPQAQEQPKQQAQTEQKPAEQPEQQKPVEQQPQEQSKKVDPNIVGVIKGSMVNTLASVMKKTGADKEAFKAALLSVIDQM